MPDKDLIYDVLEDKPDEEGWPATLNEITSSFVRQMRTVIRRKRLDLYDKKPGAVPECETKMIFIRMIKRVGSFNRESSIHKVCNLRAKFNDSLNDATAKIDQYILTINSCNAYENFDKHGNLSIKGKQAFWWELDNLIYRFEDNKVKLLPNPKNPPHKRAKKSAAYNKFAQDQREYLDYKQALIYQGDNFNRTARQSASPVNRRRLPTPLAYRKY